MFEGKGMLHEEVKPRKCSAGEEKSNGKELSNLARADLILKPNITSNMTTKLVEVQLMVWWRVAPLLFVQAESGSKCCGR